MLDNINSARSILGSLRDFHHNMTHQDSGGRHMSWLVKKIEIDIKEKLNSTNGLNEPENVVLLQKLSSIISSIDVSEISSIEKGLKRLKSFMMKSQETVCLSLIKKCRLG
jgi:hypothetical protein